MPDEEAAETPQDKCIPSRQSTPPADLCFHRPDKKPDILPRNIHLVSQVQYVIVDFSGHGLKD